MCWQTFEQKHWDALVANEDIKVMKILALTHNGTLFEPGQIDTDYNIGMLMPTVEIKPYLYCNDWHDKNQPVAQIIDKGYHSYTECTVKVYGINSPYYRYNYVLDFDAINQIIPSYYGLMPFECIIPKGTKYYANEFYEIVSETIKVIKPHVLYIHENSRFIYDKSFEIIKKAYNEYILTNKE